MEIPAGVSQGGRKAMVEHFLARMDGVQWECVWYDGLIVRAKPESDAAEVGELDYGDRVTELEKVAGWVRHAAGWNRIEHAEIPGIEFLKELDPNQNSVSVTLSYEEQRAAMARQEQEMLEKVLEESRKCAADGNQIKLGGTFEPLDGVLDWFIDQTRELIQAGGIVREAGFCSPTRFFYYGCGPYKDQSWGCAYRATQMLMDCVQRRQSAEGVTVMTAGAGIEEMQQACADRGTHLLTAGCKPFPLQEVGTTKWFEPPLTAQLMRSGALSPPVLMMDFEIRRENQPFQKLRAFLSRHFSKSGPRTAVMVDDAMFAYTICGIRLLESGTEGLPEWEVLVFDPHIISGLEAESTGLTMEHYTNGTAFELKCTTPDKSPGATKWVKYKQFFDRTRWMICFPVVEMVWSMEWLDFQKFSIRDPPIATPGEDLEPLWNPKDRRNALEF
eukprot:TRINITY_DN4528_c0_g1_i3.p1 TRINITY_DN4528_c0_g1~~TRINITY_DN4528_c0_g1_i3.p1  ORF type:complete len:444 (-),score=106.34 TRINITY_DN4528_c0_g1_i3:232-1563(-)